MNFGFIIPTHCSLPQHKSSLLKCIESIRKFYPKNMIVIINDKSSIKLSFTDDENIEIVDSCIEKGGEVNSYIMFLENKYFDKAIILHDGMYMKKKLIDIEKIDNVLYIWYFTNHRFHWSFINEPKSEYNQVNNIRNHDDLILHCINKYDFNENFKKYSLKLYHQKHKWSGCFGLQSIITHNFLVVLQEKTNIITVFKKFNNRRLRMVAESLFAIACQFVLGNDISEKSYDGLYYDGINPVETKPGYCCDKEYFKKISFNR